MHRIIKIVSNQSDFDTDVDQSDHSIFTNQQLFTSRHFFKMRIFFCSSSRRSELIYIQFQNFICLGGSPIPYCLYRGFQLGISKVQMFEHFPLWSIGWPRDFLKMSIAVSGSNPCCSIKKRDTKYPVRFTPCEQWTPMAKKSYLEFFVKAFFV